MARIIGDWTGTTFKDFLILPDGYTTYEHSPESVNIETDLAGVVLKRPFLPAAMRSVVGKEMALASGKLGMMPVVPRGLNIELAVDIVRYVKANEVAVGEIESEEKPVTVMEDDRLDTVLENVRKYGHSNIPVLNRLAEFRGIFVYKPIEHDTLDPTTPVTQVMQPFKSDGSSVAFCRDTMTDEQIRDYLKKKRLRYVPVLDSVGRLRKLVFLQQIEAYKIGGAIDTHSGWEKRAEALVKAGVDMIFTDTSDGYTEFEHDVIRRYKEMFPNGPPICGGNIVTPDGFDKLVEAGADAVKIGMGSGSICTTNIVLGVGAPPFWALKKVADRRDERAKEKYIPIIIDGGIEDTWDMNVAMTHADAIMAGRAFACFHESAGELLERDGEYFKEYYGEGSKRAAETSGDLRRYRMGKREFVLYQGVDSLVPYKGHIKPGVEEYCKALRLALSHTGCKNWPEYRARSQLLRLSEGAKRIANVHGVKVVGE